MKTKEKQEALDQLLKDLDMMYYPNLSDEQIEAILENIIKRNQENFK